MAVVVYEGVRAFRETAQDALKTRADVLHESVSSWDEAMVLAVQNLSQQPDIISMQPAQQELALMNMADVYTDMYLILTTDLDGDNVARSDGGAPNNYADRAWFQSAAAGNPVTRQSLISRTTGKPVIGYASPIRSREGDVVGVAFAGTELTTLANTVGAVQIGETGFAFLVDANGNVLAHPDPAYSADELVNLSSYRPVQRFLTGQSGFFRFTDEDRVWYAHIETLDNGWGVIVQQPQTEALAGMPVFLAVLAILTLIVMVSIALLTWWVSGRAVQPVLELTAVATAVSAGQLDKTTPIIRNDEIGKLAAAFNSMTQQLRGLVGSLEQRVASRTRDLALAADIGQDIAQIRDLDKLLTTAVERIASRFDFYYVQIYLTDEAEEKLILRAGTGAIGQELLAKGHRLALDANSINGLTAVQKQPIIVADTAQAPFFQPNPALPFTRSEMAVPLLTGDRVLGVLDLQSAEPDALNPDNVPAFEALAGQLAVAIENARLLSQRSHDLDSLQESQRQYQAILDAITLPLLISRLSDGQILTANQLLADQLGTEVAQLEGRQTPNFYYSVEDRQQVIGRIQEKGTIRNYELRLCRTNGEMFWASLSAQLFQMGDEPAIITIFSDVTEQKETAVLLQERVKQLNILNEIGRKTEQKPAVPEFLTWVAERIPDAMKAPHICLAAITYQGQVYGQAAAIQLPTQIVEGLRIGGELLGQICIAYTEKRAFENEESALIGGIGQRVSSYIETQTLITQIQARAAELQTVSEVGTAIAVTLDAQKLLQDVTNLTKERFNLYHAQIYLLDNQNEELVLTTGAGKVGQQMLAERHAIRLSSARSLVARAARERQGVTVNDIHSEPGFLPNPLLPLTHAEMAVPIIAGSTLLGVLDVQSELSGQFDAEEILIYTTLASQIAVALQNARQYERAQTALEEVNALQRAMTREGWQTYMTAVNRSVHGYQTDNNQIQPLQDTTARSANGQTEAFALPLAVRGTPIGRLGIRTGKNNLSADEISLLESISQQVGEALERARLAEQTQLALAETETLSQLSARLNAVQNYQEINDVVKAALRTRTNDTIGAILFEVRANAQGQPEGLTMLSTADTGGIADSFIPFSSAMLNPNAPWTHESTPILISDLNNDTRLGDMERNIYQGIGYRSVAFLPLRLAGRWVGLFSLFWHETVQFTPVDERLITAMMDQITLAVNSLQLLNAAQKRAQQEQLLREVTARVSAAVDAESVLQTATREIGRALGVETFIYLKSSKNQPAETATDASQTASLEPEALDGQALK